MACFLAVPGVIAFCLADLYQGTEIFFAPALPVEYRFGTTMVVGLLIMNLRFLLQLQEVRS